MSGKSFLIAVLVLVICALVMAGGALAWTDDVGVCLEPGDQTYLKVVKSGSGALVFWADSASGDIWVNKMLGASPAPTPELVISGNNLIEYQVTSDGNSGAIVAWAARANGGRIGIFALRVESNGVPGPSPTEICSLKKYRGKINMCTSVGDGGAIIVWEDSRDYHNNGQDIYAQKIDIGGNMLWPGGNGFAVCTAPENQDLSGIAVASNGNGGAIITWYGYNDATNGSDVYAQHVNSNGVPQWATNGKVMCTGTENQGNSGIVSAASGTGIAILGWHVDSGNGDGWDDLYMQKINSSGGFVDTRVDINNQSNIEYGSGFASNGQGGGIVVWDVRNGNVYDIYAQSMGGLTEWGPIPVCTLSVSERDRGFPTTVSDGNAGAIIAWFDNRSGNMDVYAQRVSNLGVPLWEAEGTRVNVTLSGDQIEPAIMGDGAGGVLIAWEDSRNGNKDIYARHISASEPTAVTITSPADSSLFSSGEMITFVGAATHPVVGDLTNSLQWTSDKDGAIGTGGSFTTALSDDAHTVTASASGVNASITITVGGAPPTGGMYVSDITTTTKYNSRKNWYDIKITVTIRRDNDVAVANATVGMGITGPVNESLSGNTNTPGEAELTLRHAPGGAYTATVADVTHGTYVYTPGLNVKNYITFTVTGGEIFVAPAKLSEQATQLRQNYPNPFNPETWIPFELSDPAHVTITIYSVTGQPVRILDLGSKAPGAHVSKADAAYWDGTNKAGEKVASGTYFYTMEAGPFKAMKKMIILK